MRKFLFRQGLSALVTLMFALLILFVILQLNSDLFLSSQMGLEANDELRILTATQFQLNFPIEVRLVKWFGRIATGKIFDSYVYGDYMLPHLLKALGRSLSIIGLSVGFGAALSMALALLSVRYRNHIFDAFIRGFSLFGISVHELTFCVFFVVLLRRSMVGLAFLGDGDPLFASAFMNFWVASLLPIIFLTLRVLGISLRYIQSAMITVAQQDFIVAERSRGISNWVIYRRSVLGNSYSAIVPSLGAMVMEAANCMIIIEIFFRVPGFFSGFYQATLRQDTNLMMMHALVAIVFVILMNSLLDLLLAAVDPRITYN